MLLQMQGFFKDERNMQSFEHWTACVTNNDCFEFRKNDMKVLLLVQKWL